jgi:hypothetical protein
MNLPNWRRRRAESRHTSESTPASPKRSSSIEFGNDIRPRAAYFEALEWPMLHQSFDDAEAMVTKHRASAHVTVETEFDAMATALGLSSTNSNFSRAKLAAAVAVTFCRFDMPEAIHWKPCEMLYRPGPFIRQFETDPISLFVRVTPFSSNREVGGVRVIGASTRAAADFLGLETVLEEAPVPVLWAMTTVEKFISQCHAHGTYLPHLASFSPNHGDVVLVRHMEATPEIDQPHISLEVRLAAQAGYDAASIDHVESPPIRRAPQWDGIERRTRPHNAKPFGRRGLT